MSSFSGDEAGNDHADGATSLVDSDRAMLLASVVWRQHRRRPETDETAVDLIAGLQGRLSEAWVQTLRGALDSEKSPSTWSDRGETIDELRRMHQAMAGVDLARIHPSWLVRALREESPAVQRLVAASLPDSLRYQMQSGLLLDSQDLKSERAAAPEVASWVMALWTERLVGGDARPSHDSPGLAVLIELTPRAGYRLCRMVGFCKLILAGQPPDHRADAGDHARHEWLAARLAEANSGLRELSRRDVEAGRSSKLPLRHQPARIGLATVARLLVDTEPFRLRWALQHWPYPIAKLIRALLPRSLSQPPSFLEWESWILKTAWERLNLDGRLVPAWPDSYSSKMRGTGAGPIMRRGSRSESSLFNRQ
jgi:hypothetical protein